MADFSFSSKASYSPTQTLGIRKASGSLALRVVLVCLALLVLPVIVDGLMVYESDYRVRIRELAVALDLMGRGKADMIDQYLKAEKKQLALLVDLINQGTLSETQFDQIASKNHFTFLRIDKSGLQTEKEGLVFFEEVLSEHRGVLVGSVSSQSLLELAEQHHRFPYPVCTTILNAADHVVATQHEEYPPPGLKVISSLTATTPFPSLDKTELLLGVKTPLQEIPIYLILDVDTQKALRFSDRGLFSHFLSLLFLIVILGGCVTWLLTRRMAKPLKALYLTMQKVGQGVLNARYKRDYMGFEVNVLGEHFNHMLEALNRHIEDAKQERLAKELLAEELRIGHEIQKTLLPKEILHCQGLDIATGFLSAQEVAGDFYDLFSKDNTLMVAVADASGKGISACLYSLGVRSMLRSFNSGRLNVEAILQKTNALFCLDTADSGVFVTAWVGIIDRTTRTLHFSCCGHPPALLVRVDGSSKELLTLGVPLGATPQAQIEVATEILQTGDLLLLYTDGLLEAQNQKGEFFGKRRLVQTVLSTHKQSSEQVVSALLEAASTFSVEAPQHDDITLVSIKII